MNLRSIEINNKYLEHEQESKMNSTKGQRYDKYAQNLKEVNLYRSIDHQDNMAKVRKSQNAYKQILASNIIEKGNRSKMLHEKHNKESQLARSTSEQIFK